MTEEKPLPKASVPLLVSHVPEAHELVKRNALWALGAGLLPLPFIDLATVTGIQMKLIKELSNLYGLRFSDHPARNIIAAFAGSYGSSLFILPVASVLKFVPLVGHIAGALALPTVTYASTYAVGKVFVQHFELGGTLFDLDPARTRAYFEEQFKEGQRFSGEWKNR
jgi:uncharacterized protein (DUF697 family)